LINKLNPISQKWSSPRRLDIMIKVENCGNCP
jgi:hypothetical protein